MKRNIIRALFATCITSVILIQACDPLEPSTYTENFFRIATVRFQDGRVSFYTDYDHEQFFPINLKDTAAAISAGLTEGLRIKVWFTFDAIGSMENNTITVNGFSKLDYTRCTGQKPSDTLNYYFYFAKYNLNHDLGYEGASYIYPSVWAEGHIVNVAPTFFVPNSSDKADFYLYPFDVREDTLFLRIYSDIPSCDVSLNPDYTQKLLNLDISSIRDSAANPAEQVLRDTILARLDRLNTDKIIIKIKTPDSLRALNSKNYYQTYLQPVSGVSTTPVTIPFDF